MKLDRSSQRYAIFAYFCSSLILAAFSLWFIRILPDGNLYNYNPNIFNLIYYIPFSMWISILMLGALLLFLLVNADELSPRFKYGMMLATLLAVFLIFYGVPHIVEPNPRFVDSWIHGRMAEGIIENGYLKPTERKFNYQSYPSSFISLSAVSLITGLDITYLLRILPPILVLLFSSTLVIFFIKVFKNSKLAIISAFIFGLSTFYLAFHCSPEIFGWIFFLLFVAFVAEGFREQSYSRRNFGLMMLLIVAIAITHPVTQFSVLLILFTLFALGRLFWKRTFVPFSLVLFSALVFAGWAASFGYPYLADTVMSFGSAFQTITSNLSGSIAAQPFQENVPEEISNLVLYRRVIYGLTFVSAFFGCFLLWKNRKERNRFNFLWGLLVASILAAPLTLFGVLPLERPIKLAFLPLCILSAYFILQKKKIGIPMLIFLTLTIPINFASIYWNEPGAMTHDWEVSSAKFIASNFHGIILGEFKETMIQQYYGDFNKVYNDYYLYGERPEVFNYNFIKENFVELVYLTQLTVQKESRAGRNMDLTSFVNSTMFDCVNSNGYSIILIRNSRT